MIPLLWNFGTCAWTTRLVRLDEGTMHVHTAVGAMDEYMSRTRLLSEMELPARVSAVHALFVTHMWDGAKRGVCAVDSGRDIQVA